MATIKEILQEAKQKLSVITTEAVLEAEILLAHALEKDRTYLHAWPEKNLTPPEIQKFTQLIERRLNKEPIAYIIGTKEFWSLEFVVTKDTLIPRPETELMVETILNLISNPQAKIADLGTGSGAIALSIAHERPNWKIHAVDISESALQIASKNAQRFALKNVSFYLGSWCTALPCADFDAILSNPPYIAETEWEGYAEGLAFEPSSALVSGEDGLVAIREISHSAKHHLKPGGYLLFEHGFAQGKAVQEILAKDGYQAIQTLKDFSGQDRVTLCRWQPSNS